MAVAVVASLVYARGRTPHARVAHVLDAFRALARSPRAAVSLVGWVTVAMGMRLLAAATIASAFDVAVAARRRRS